VPAPVWAFADETGDVGSAQGQRYRPSTPSSWGRRAYWSCSRSACGRFWSAWTPKTHPGRRIANGCTAEPVDQKNRPG